LPPRAGAGEKSCRLGRHGGMHTAPALDRRSADMPASFRRAAIAAVAALVAGAAHAQIVIGQSAGFSGAVAASVKEATDGAKLAIDAVNAKGGIGGQQVELVSLDDKFDPPLTVANTKKLIEERGVVAMFLNRGTPHTEAIRPLLEQHKVPLVGPSTGAMVLHKPVHPLIFNVRAPYLREAEKAVQHLATIGMTKIAVVHVDDAFGADAVAGATKGFQAAKLEPVMVGKFDRSKPVYGPIVEQIAKTEPQAVLFIGSGVAVVDGMKAIRAGGSKAQFVTLSNNASAGFVKLLGEMARGTIVTQVFPSERAVAVPFVKEATSLAGAKQLTLTPQMMEGYAAAKVLLEGLRRAGPKPTRESLTAALNGLSRYDLGGLELGYSPANHTGLVYVDLSIIGADGRFMR
jgi:branched-chain amino acid transport system substrate-binding protein